MQDASSVRVLESLEPLCAALLYDESECLVAANSAGMALYAGSGKSESVLARLKGHGSLDGGGVAKIATLGGGYDVGRPDLTLVTVHSQASLADSSEAVILSALRLLDYSRQMDNALAVLGNLTQAMGEARQAMLTEIDALLARHAEIVEGLTADAG